jgi:hypothetical protein
MQNSAAQSFQLHPVSAAYRLPVGAIADGNRWAERRKKALSWQAVYSHFQKWSADGSLERAWQGGIISIRDPLDLSQLNLDGSHAPAKKVGASVAFQQRKRAPTSNTLPITERNGYGWLRRASRRAIIMTPST